MQYRKSFEAFITLCLASLLNICAQISPISFELSTAHRGSVIGPLHYGIFYEEINHAGDGGLYAELIRNGSFEENGSNPDYWWTIADATFSISSQNLLNGAQKRAMHLNMKKAGDGTRNIGYWGINIEEGQKYKASFWVRTADNWTGDITLTLESFEGADLGHATVHVSDAGSWRKYSAEITAAGSYQLGWFAIRGSKAGTIYLDCISLFPPTYKNRENGMRRDLAEKLAALHPRFMRFPGGCYIEGGQRYQWKHTIGPVEERLGIYNSNWGYPVSNGMGFHEFLQLAEDLGAEPLFVVNVGMGHGWFQDYQHIEGFIQEALDAIEYCNGDVTTFWGAKRAAAGHPQPFHLKFMEIGNENYNYTSDGNRDQSDHYAERYAQFYRAIKDRYPEMTLIGNSDWGSDYPTWRNQYPLEIIDEHFYRSPDWFASMYHKYDYYSRSSNKVYNGEYAVTQDFGTNGTLKAALGEAIYMAGLERNSDVCVMNSYAPIFMNENESQWRPDMLHYNAYASFGTPSYWTQQMMASTVGHQNLTWSEQGNAIGLTSAKLGLGSWGTDVTYSNICVTDSHGHAFDGFPVEAFHSPATTFGTARIFDVVTENCTIELDAVKNSGDEGFLIAFAFADNNNFAWWNLGGWGNTRHGVEQAVGGQKTTLATADGTIETGQTYHIKIVRSGRSTELYLDGELISTAVLSEREGQRLFLCASINDAEDTAILKVINYNAVSVPTTFSFADASMHGQATMRVMSNPDNYAENSMEHPMNVSPQNRTLTVQDGTVAYEVPAYSLSIIEIPISDVTPEQKTQADTHLPTPAIAYSFENGKPQSDDEWMTGNCEGGASIITLDDGNHAAYTGPDAENGYFNLGNEAAQIIGSLLNNPEHSVSVNLMFADAGQLNNYCWAWCVANGTNSYAGLINHANNLNWYYERVQDTTTKAASNAGLRHYSWHNLTITSDDDLVRLYIDGHLRATAIPPAAPLDVTTQTVAWLGCSPFAADARMTSTFFDDFLVFDETLTPAQVLALYESAAAKSTTCTSLHPEAEKEANETALQIIDNGENVDITSLLINPDFADGTKGWEGTLFSAAPGTVAEHYYQLFDTYQILPNMPTGKYRLQWQGFYRDGNIANAFLRHEAGTEHMAEVYATAGELFSTDLASTKMLSLYDANAPFTREPYTYPDNVTTANEAFQAGHYVQQLDFTLSEISDLRIGLRNFVPTVYDWVCVDNVRLIYLGADVTAIRHQMINGKSVYGKWFDLSGRAVTRPAKGIYIFQGKKIIIK